MTLQVRFGPTPPPQSKTSLSHFEINIRIRSHKPGGGGGGEVHDPIGMYLQASPTGRLVKFNAGLFLNGIHVVSFVVFGCILGSCKFVHCLGFRIS